MSTPSIEADRSRLASVLGADVRTLEPKWLEYMRQGVICRLHIHRWRGWSKLSWDDLGIKVREDEQDVFNDLLSLGRKKLLPAEIIRELDGIESAWRKALESESYETYWGRFLPATNFDNWKTRSASFEKRYTDLRNKIYRNYTTIQAELLETYRVAARAAYRRLIGLEPGAKRRLGSEAEFVATFVSAIENLMPPAKDVRKSFSFEIEYDYVPLPSLLAEDTAAATRIALDGEQADALRRMNAEVVEGARRAKQEMVDGYLKDVVSQLRGMIYDAATDALEAMQRHDGSLPPRSVVALRTMIARVNAMNFFNDADARAITGTLAEALAVTSENRDLAAVQEKLSAMATVLRSSLLELGATPRGVRSLGLVGEPEPLAVRRARRSLDLDAAPVPVPTQRRLSLADALPLPAAQVPESKSAVAA